MGQQTVEMTQDNMNEQNSDRNLRLQISSALEGTAALLLLAFNLPVFIIVAILIKATSRGPVLYSQTRVGKNGKHFKILKFRTMSLDAESQSGPVLSQKQDARVTPLGIWLRNLHIDEIPQLINVLRGEMSFIGPRPERPYFTEQFEARIPNYALRHSVLPGIMGLAQIRLPYDARPEEKLVYDLQYVEQVHSFSLKAKIVWATMKKLIFVRYNQ